MCWLNMTGFGFVMVSFIARKFIGALVGTVNCTIPGLDDVGVRYENVWAGKILENIKFT